MPTVFDNRPINAELIDITKTGKPELIQAILDKGGNPFATIKTTTGVRNVLLNALSLGKSKIVTVLLQHTEKPGQKIIDLSQTNPCEDPENPEPMNIIQVAILKSSRTCSVLLHDYFVKHSVKHSGGKTYASVINKPFLVLYSDGKYRKETIGHTLLKTVSINSISNNSNLYKSQQEDEIVNRSFAQWLAHAVSNPNPPDEVEYFGPLAAFEFLVPKELDVLATDYKGKTIVSFSNELEECTLTPVLWEANGRTRLQFIFVEQTETSLQNGRGGISIPMTMSNLFNANPFVTTLVPKFTKLNKYLADAAAAQIAPPTPGVVALSHTVAAHGLLLDEHSTLLAEHTKQIAALEVTVARLCTEMASTAEAQFKAACANLAAYPSYQRVFQTLQSTIESLVRQKRDAKLKVFATNPSREYRTAYTLLSLVSFTLQCCPAPFASVIPALGQMLLNFGSALRESRKHSAIFDATIDIKPDFLATYVSAYLVAEAMQSYGDFDIPTEYISRMTNGLFEIVAAKVDKMYTQTFHDPEDVLGFLCVDAITKIHVHKADSPEAESKRADSGDRFEKGPAQQLAERAAASRRASVTSTSTAIRPASAAGGKCVVM